MIPLVDTEAKGQASVRHLHHTRIQRCFACLNDFQMHRQLVLLIKRQSVQADTACNASSTHPSGTQAGTCSSCEEPDSMSS